MLEKSVLHSYVYKGDQWTLFNSFGVRFKCENFNRQCRFLHRTNKGKGLKKGWRGRGKNLENGYLPNFCHFNVTEYRLLHCLTKLPRGWERSLVSLTCPESIQIWISNVDFCTESLKAKGWISWDLKSGCLLQIPRYVVLIIIRVFLINWEI